MRQYFRQGYWKNGLRDDKFAHLPSAALLKAVLINGAQRLWYQDQPSLDGSGKWIAPTLLPGPEQGYGESLRMQETDRSSEQEKAKSGARARAREQESKRARDREIESERKKTDEGQ